MTPWHHGIMTPWHRDAVTLWYHYHDSLTPWHHDIMTPRHHVTSWHRDTVTPWHHDTMTPRHHDIMTPRHLMISWHRDIVTSCHRDTMMPRHHDITATTTPRHHDIIKPRHIVTPWHHATVPPRRHAATSPWHHASAVSALERTSSVGVLLWQHWVNRLPVAPHHVTPLHTFHTPLLTRWSHYAHTGEQLHPATSVTVVSPVSRSSGADLITQSPETTLNVHCAALVTCINNSAPSSPVVCWRTPFCWWWQWAKINVSANVSKLIRSRWCW